MGDERERERTGTRVPPQKPPPIIGMHAVEHSGDSPDQKSIPNFRKDDGYSKCIVYGCIFPEPGFLTKSLVHYAPIAVVVSVRGGKGKLFGKEMR